jgi:hypothetical protein
LDELVVAEHVRREVVVLAADRGPGDCEAAALIEAATEI